MSDPCATIIQKRQERGMMRTIDELVNEIYMDNEQHLEFMENMNGGDCDCKIHSSLELITKYWWDEGE